ncbi:unnamed protein product [Periconia digitata]|uniref:N-acetyltransferase domain-containing protein n=1 Tax=Periconia digitata TaxID=1303443 RepID=A0A9W4UL64_9PLEO|nr:unnamed protein product [Periconia digitata]
MPLTTSTDITIADLPHLASLDYESWQTPPNPQLKHFRPPFPSRGAAETWYITSRTARVESPDPNTDFVKCYDEETGEIVGCAVWFVNHGLQEGKEKKKVEATWHAEGSEEREFAERFVNGLWGFIDERVPGPRMDLHSIITSPKHRKNGCARLLLAHGKQKADALNIPIVISSLPSARGAYEKCGFGAIEVIPPHPSLKGREEEVEGGMSDKWRSWCEEDLSGWLMWRPVGRDYREGDKAPWVVDG